MVVYEVNLVINNEIFADYYDWLIGHINNMLKFSGFQQAEIFEEKQNDTENKNLTVRYTIASENNLNDYLQHHASTMRAEAVLKFGEKFSASRRILKPKVLAITQDATLIPDLIFQKFDN